MNLIKYIVIFLTLSIGSANAQEINSVLDKSRNDARYLSAENLVNEFGLVLDEDKFMLREVSKNVALLIPVMNSARESVGSFSIYGEKWKIAFFVNGSIKAFNILVDEGGFSSVEELNPEDNFLKKMVFTPDYSQNGGFLKTSITGSNYCMYTSKVGMDFRTGCWSPDENPFSYYFVVTYREGSKITKYSQSWWADYKGRAVVCPRKDTKVIKLPQCGFPPD
ncbi:MAG: hypothetical protein RLZZ230_583 [Candidatus Parcubacteria bacterium]|jgi:hypothetical protein